MIEGEILTIAVNLLDRYLDPEWQIVFTDEQIIGRSKKRKGKVILAGHTSWDKKLIRLYRPIVAKYSLHDLVMIVTHEIAHAMTPGDLKHGSDFRKKWIELYEENETPE